MTLLVELQMYQSTHNPTISIVWRVSVAILILMFDLNLASVYNFRPTHHQRKDRGKIECNCNSVFRKLLFVGDTGIVFDIRD